MLFCLISFYSALACTRVHTRKPAWGGSLKVYRSRFAMASLPGLKTALFCACVLLVEISACLKIFSFTFSEALSQLGGFMEVLRMRNHCSIHVFHPGVLPCARIRPPARHMVSKLHIVLRHARIVSYIVVRSVLLLPLGTMRHRVTTNLSHYTLKKLAQASF